MMRNSPESLALIFALPRAGFVCVPVNAQLRREGLRHVLSHVERRAVVADAEALPRIGECGAAPTGAALVIASDAAARCG